MDNNNNEDRTMNDIDTSKTRDDKKSSSSSSSLSSNVDSGDDTDEDFVKVDPFVSSLAFIPPSLGASNLLEKSSIKNYDAENIAFHESSVKIFNTDINFDIDQFAGRSFKNIRNQSRSFKNNFD